MQIHELKPTHKARKAQRIGRGGKRGTYSGKGVKGQKARSGHRIRPALRDLLIRLPKLKGTKNKSLQTKPLSINLKTIETRVKENVINMETLFKAGLVRNVKDKVKILSVGDIKRALTLQGLPVSKKTQEKIEAAGGKVENSK